MHKSLSWHFPWLGSELQRAVETVNRQQTSRRPAHRRGEKPPPRSWKAWVFSSEPALPGAGSAPSAVLVKHRRTGLAAQAHPNSTVFFYWFYFCKYCIYYFRERGREGEREGGKRRCATETRMGWLSRTPAQGPGLHPRRVP